MTNPIVCIDTSDIRDGRADEVEAAARELAAFVEANEPSVVAYEISFDADRKRMTVLQIHPSSASMELHMKLAGPSRRALRGSRYYSLVLAPLGITDVLTAVIPSAKSHPKIFSFDRVGGEFTPRDRAVLDFLQPHLTRIRRAAQTRARLRAALAALERTAKHDRRGVIVLGDGTTVEFASPAARRLVRNYFGDERFLHLPSELADWLASGASTLVRRQGGRCLTVDRSGDALLLEETGQEALLTPREREILAWVACGKTNNEVAEILWISPATVRKHLENVYAKLGVRTRTAAAARFLGAAEQAESGTP